MKKQLLLFILFPLVAAGQTVRNEIVIPDIDGYHTLKCDLHIHSVFSDGLVWPTVRVDEAYLEGLDAIAITEHIEYRPFKGDVSSSHNRAWELASKYAAGKDIIVIRGSEITRGMPPGHFNAVFLEDCDALDTPEYMDAFGAASQQDAFIFWNHPGWASQAPDTTVWLPEHTLLYEKGLMHGIEIVNSGSYYPEAHCWALEKGLTILGNSDVHKPMQYILEVDGREHRPMTLVFAATRDEKGIKDALLNRRTAVYHRDGIYGEDKFLRQIFLNAVKVESIKRSPTAISVTVRNESGLEYQLRKTDHGGDFEYFRYYRIAPFGKHTITFKLKNGITGGTVNFEVTNLIPEPGKGLQFSYEL